MERAITLYQPIASLMVRGIKTVETRSWPTKVRGTLFIHAAKAFPPDSWIEKYVNDPVFRFYCFGSHRWTAKEAMELIRTETSFLKEFPRGKLLGSVFLHDCIEGKHARERLSTLDYRREKALGDLVGPDRFAWLTTDPNEFKDPIEASGSQGFWDCESYIRASNPVYK